MTYSLISSHVPALSYDDMEREAYMTENKLALAICSKVYDLIEEAVEQALTTNDADYSYTVYDAVSSIQFLLYEAEWYKDSKIKDKIVYRIMGVHEDTNPYNNDVIISRVPGSDRWLLEAQHGQYGEEVISRFFEAGGYKKAQERAVDILIEEIKMGAELNINV